MKVIIHKKPNGEMLVQYTKIFNLKNFRYCLLANILASTDQDITLFIDTNQRIAVKPIEQIESYLQQMQIHYFVTLTETNPGQFFGITLPTNKKKPLREHKIVFELPDNTFSRELFEVIQNYDISIGLGKNKTFEELCTDYKTDNILVVSNPECFEQSLYDSIICERMRTSFNVEQFVRKTENEIAI